MRKVLERCPSCGGPLEVTRMACTQCDTIIHAHYSPCRFCNLDPDQTRLLEAFVKARGNVKEMERDLGISYWTIRKRVDELVAVLGLEEDEPRHTSSEPDQLEILNQLDRGEIDAETAAQLIAQLKT